MGLFDLSVDAVSLLKTSKQYPALTVLKQILLLHIVFEGVGPL